MHTGNFNFIVHVIDSVLLMKYFFLHAFKVATGSFVASGRCLNQNVMHCVFSLFDDHHIHLIYAYEGTHIVVHVVHELQKYSFWGKKPYSTVRQLFVANELIADQSCL